MKRSTHFLLLTSLACLTSVAYWGKMHALDQTAPQPQATLIHSSAAAASRTLPTYVDRGTPTVRETQEQLGPRVLLADGSPAAGLRLRTSGQAGWTESVVMRDGQLSPQPLPGVKPELVESSLSSAELRHGEDEQGTFWTVDLVAVDVLVIGPSAVPEEGARLVLGPATQGRWSEAEELRIIQTDDEGVAQLHTLPGEHLLEARSGFDVGHLSAHLGSRVSSRASLELRLDQPVGRAGLHLTVTGPQGEQLPYQALLQLPGGGPVLRVLRSEDAPDGQHWGLPPGNFELRLISRSRAPASLYAVERWSDSLTLEVGQVASLELEPVLRGRLSLDLSSFPADGERIEASMRRIDSKDWDHVEELSFHDGGYSIAIDLAGGGVCQTAELLAPGHYELRLEGGNGAPRPFQIFAGETTLVSL